jgi:hypothetical protein
MLGFPTLKVEDLPSNLISKVEAIFRQKIEDLLRV